MASHYYIGIPIQNLAEKLRDWNIGMVEYWNNGLNERKNGESVFPGFTLMPFQPNIPSFHYSIIPNRAVTAFL